MRSAFGSQGRAWAAARRLTLVPLFRAERALVEFDPALWTPERLAEVRRRSMRTFSCIPADSFSLQEIDDMGFEATPIIAMAADTVSLQVYGMTCAGLNPT